MSDNTVVVIDNGSGVLKAGTAGEETPSVKFPSIVGVPRIEGKQLIGAESKDQYIGDEAQKMRGVLKLKYPIESGIVKDWDDMTSIWQYAFGNELRLDPEETNVLLTEAPGNPKTNREKMTTIMFETLKVSGLYISIQAVLSLYANGRTTGLVVDSGDGVTHTVPVFEGFTIPHGVFKNFIAGRAITKTMVNMLTLEGIEKQGGEGAWFQNVALMKEKTGYVALDYDSEKKKATESTECNKDFELPDGQTITIKTARFSAPEALFTPNFHQEGSEDKGMAELATDSIESCDVDIRTDLYGNVILSGGSTLYPGLPERLEKDLKAKQQGTAPVKILAPPERYYSVWVGGSTLASLSTFASSWITKDEYEENGAEIVHRKCQ